MPKLFNSRFNSSSLTTLITGPSVWSDFQVVEVKIWFLGVVQDDKKSIGLVNDEGVCVGSFLSLKLTEVWILSSGLS